MNRLASDSSPHSFIGIFTRLLILIGLVLACGGAFTYLATWSSQMLFGVGAEALMISDFSDVSAAELNAFKLIQGFSLIGLFLLPALLFPLFVNRSIVDYLHIRKTISLKITGISVLLLLLLYPLISLSLYLNQQMVFPEFLQGFEQWAREKEDSLAELSMMLVEAESIRTLMLNLLIIAVIPAIAEEFFFRGAIQSWLSENKLNKHLAVWVTAIIFSAVHMQFFSFLPRVFLGAFLGYLLVWKQNIWYPVIAHFLNNALVLIVSYLVTKGIIDMEAETLFQNGSTWPWYLKTLLVLFGLLLAYTIYRIRAPKHKDTDREGWSKVYTTNDNFKAEVIKGVLETENINAVVMNKRDSAYTAFGEIDVYVKDEDFFEAKEVLIKQEKQQ
jgi:uncharacterized protein